MEIRRRFLQICLVVFLLVSALAGSLGAPGQTLHADGPVPFTRHVVDGNFYRPEYGHVLDLDQDGDTDILGISDYGRTVAWWENDGSQGFSRHEIGAVSYRGATAYGADIDGDGDNDVLATGHHGSNDILWLENDGAQGFSKHIVGFTEMPRCAYPVDLDQDGDVDVVSVDQAGAVKWWENDGNESFAERTISTVYISGYWVRTADIDGDSDIDLITASDSVVWWENDGSEGFTAHEIETSYANPRGLEPVDLDQDGDLDVVGCSASYGEVTWWENDGSQVFTKHLIDGTVTFASAAYPGDLDGDGDLDVLGAITLDGTVEWWENDGWQNFTQHTVATGFGGTLWAEFADVDQDGDLDVVASAYDLGDIVWWENTLEPVPCSSQLEAVDDEVSANEDGPAVTIDVLANDSPSACAVGPLAVVSIDTTSTRGTVSFTSGDVTYDPNGQFEPLAAGETASDSFSYSVSDGDGGTDTAVASVTILGENDAPTLYLGNASRVVDEGQKASNGVTVSDPDSALLSLWASVGIITDKDGTWSWEFETKDGPDESQIVTISADDGDGGVAEVAFALTVSNAVPAVDSVSNDGPINEGGTATVSVVASDPAGANDPLTYEFDCDNDLDYEIGPQLHSGAVCAFGDDGTFEVNVLVTDDDGAADTASTAVVVLDLGSTAAFTWAAEPQDEGSPVDFADESTSVIDDIVDWTWDFAGLATSTDQNPSFTFPDDGTHKVCLTVYDDDGSTDTVCRDVTVRNVAPSNIVLAVDQQVIDENDSVNLSGAFDDPGLQDEHTVTIDWGDGESNTLVLPVGDRAFAAPHQYLDDNPTGTSSDVYTVNVTVADDGDQGTADTEVTVKNVGPTIDVLTAPVEPVDINDQSSIVVDVTFSDRGTKDTHDITWDWGDSNGDTQEGASSPASQGHTYATPGVYPITVTVTDDDLGSATQTHKFIVIYDPSGGFVTGGGWIMSSEAACQFEDCEDETTGKANFGFVSKYKKGASVPTGNTEFQFKAGNLDFHSTSYDWLVVTGSDYAKFKGSGAINGQLDPNSQPYRFQIWAGDGEPDTFRIKIWEEDDLGNETDVYDNGFDQAIGGGNIVVHTK